MSSTVVVQRDERGVLSIELNRPEVRNALLPEMLGVLGDTIAAHADDPATRIVLLSGAGKSFCAGGDASAAPADFPIAWEALTRLLLGLRHCPKPVVARVQGHALGVGCSLALAADFTLAETSAHFRWPFVKMGLVPEGTQLALRCLPPSMLQSFALLGEPLTGTDLAAAKAIHAAVEPGGLETATDELVAGLLALPDFGLAAVKQSLLALPALSFADSLAWEGRMQAAIRSSPEFANFRAAYFSSLGVKPRADR